MSFSCRNLRAPLSVMLFCIYSIAAAAAVPVVESDNALAQALPNRTITTAEESLIYRAKQITVDHKLTALPLACLKFERLDDEHEGQIIVDVRENHQPPCQGDPDTAPRLFSIGFDRITAEIWTDAKSPVGQMERLEQAPE